MLLKEQFHNSGEIIDFKETVPQQWGDSCTCTIVGTLAVARKQSAGKQ